MYTAAGLISGAPRPMSIPDAIRAAGGRPTLLIAGGSVADARFEAEHRRRRTGEGSAALAFAPYLIVVALFAIATFGPVKAWLAEHGEELD